MRERKLRRRAGSSPVSAKSSKKSQDIRLFAILIGIAVLFAIMFYRLWKLQVVDGVKYAKNYELKVTKTVRGHNARGVVYDCNGEALAYNELTYVATMVDDGSYGSKREQHLTLNSKIFHIAKKLEENEEQINQGLKIRARRGGGYEYTVSGGALLRFQADVFGKANPADLTQAQKSISAKEMVQFLASDDKFALYGQGGKEYSKKELEEYGLPKEYSEQEVLAVLGIRYLLSLNSYQKYIPVILAKDVSEKTVAYIYENQQSLAGIGVEEDYKRIYAGGEALSHVLGYTGKISTEELGQYASTGRGYTADSVVGKAGIEQFLETQLQGVDGERQIIVNNVGKVVGEEKVIRETLSGRDVHLSIDKNLQVAIYHMLEQNLAGILASNLINAKEFDKAHVLDTSNIRIPIYDVYFALIDNNVASIGDLRRPEASELEKGMAEALEAKRGEALESLRKELLEGSLPYGSLPKEMQGYLSYIITETGIFKEEALGKEGYTYQKWKEEGQAGVKEFLAHVVEQGWVEEGVIDSARGYFTTDERCALLADAIGEKLGNDQEFEKMLVKRLIFEDKITGKDLCRLLYEQQVLQHGDGDYGKLMSGAMDSFSFLKKKIEQLELTPAQLALDPCSASAVAVQPKTGKVLALVSYPGYDNNRLANQIDSEYYSQLLQDKSLPLYNRATQQLTAPGSTFKPVTVVAGLQEGVISPVSSVICDGIFDKVVPSLRCWKHSGHGTVPGVPDALQFSCNDYLCEIAYRMGAGDGADYVDSVSLKRLQEYARKFYFDKKSGVEVIESEPHVTDAYGIPSAIGQGTHNYATAQLARYVSIIASKGDAFSLSLVNGAVGEDGAFKEKACTLEGKVELPASVWDAVHAGMVQFAKNNAVLKDMQISVAGKTGTAQEAKNRPDHALFVGFAPVEDPEVALAVRIANGYGSSNATAVGKHIFNYYFGLESWEEIITGEASQAFNTRTD